MENEREKKRGEKENKSSKQQTVTNAIMDEVKIGETRKIDYYTLVIFAAATCLKNHASAEVNNL